MEFQQWVGLTIAVLTILVTVLITWQIWQTIISRNEIKSLTKLNDELNASLEERVRKIYEDINEHAEQRKNTLEIVKTLQNDYESSTEVMINFVLLRNSQPSYRMLEYAIKVFKACNDPENLKARTALEVLDASVSDALAEKGKYQQLVNEIPYEDICWLYSYDYSKKECSKFIKNMDEYKSRLEQLMKLYLK